MSFIVKGIVNVYETKRITHGEEDSEVEVKVHLPIQAFGWVGEMCLMTRTDVPCRFPLTAVARACALGQASAARVAAHVRDTAVFSNRGSHWGKEC